MILAIRKTEECVVCTITRCIHHPNHSGCAGCWGLEECAHAFCPDFKCDLLHDLEEAYLDERRPNAGYEEE